MSQKKMYAEYFNTWHIKMLQLNTEFIKTPRTLSKKIVLVDDRTKFFLFIKEEGKIVTLLPSGIVPRAYTPTKILECPFSKRRKFLSWLNWFFKANNKISKIYPTPVLMPMVHANLLLKNSMHLDTVKHEGMCDYKPFFEAKQFQKNVRIPIRYNNLIPSDMPTFSAHLRKWDSYLRIWNSKYRFTLSTVNFDYYGVTGAFAEFSKETLEEREFCEITNAGLEMMGCETFDINDIKPTYAHQHKMILVKIFLRKSLYLFYLKIIQMTFKLQKLLAKSFGPLIFKGDIHQFLLYSRIVDFLNFDIRLKKKLKIKKWKFFRKKMRWVKLYRRFRLMLKFRLVKRKFLFIKTVWSHLSIRNMPLHRRSITNKIPLSNKLVNNTYLDFFYKRNKDPQPSASCYVYNVSHTDYHGLDDIFNKRENNLKLLLRNYNQKPYWKFRLARIVHWNFFFKKKTIHQQRYKQFINKYMKTYSRYYSFLYYLISALTKFNISWGKIKRFALFCKTEIVTNDGSMIFLPIFFKKFFNWRVFKHKNFKKRKKIGKWAFMNYKRMICPWLQKKKNFPKSVIHVIPHVEFFKQYAYLDYMTGYMFFFNAWNNVNISIPSPEQFKTNFLIKLHMFRYKAN